MKSFLFPSTISIGIGRVYWTAPKSSPARQSDLSSKTIGTRQGRLAPFIKKFFAVAYRSSTDIFLIFVELSKYLCYKGAVTAWPVDDFCRLCYWRYFFPTTLKCLRYASFRVTATAVGKRVVHFHRPPFRTVSPTQSDRNYNITYDRHNDIFSVCHLVIDSHFPNTIVPLSPSDWRENFFLRELELSATAYSKDKSYINGSNQFCTLFICFP